MLTRAMQRVFCASIARGLSATLKNREPSLDIIDVNLNKEEMLTEKDLKVVSDNAEIIVADLPVIYQLFSKPTKLKWVHSTWAGADYLTRRLKDTEMRPSFLLTKNHCGFGEQMAEYVLSYILAYTRHLFEANEFQKEKDWSSCRSVHMNYRALKSLSIGILGLGYCGKHVAETCKYFGMEVWALTRTAMSENNKSYVDQHRVFSQENLIEVLSNCDFICSILPSTEQTRGLLAGDMLSHCKSKKPVFINLGRGDITDEASIVRALENGWISGAVLDVFTEEPLPKDSPLWSMPNVHITPHSSAISFSTDIAQSFLENYGKYVKREPLISPVDLQAGY